MGEAAGSLPPPARVAGESIPGGPTFASPTPSTHDADWKAAAIADEILAEAAVPPPTPPPPPTPISPPPPPTPLTPPATPPGTARSAPVTRGAAAGRGDHSVASPASEAAKDAALDDRLALLANRSLTESITSRPKRIRPVLAVPIFVVLLGAVIAIVAMSGSSGNATGTTLSQANGPGGVTGPSLVKFRHHHHKKGHKPPVVTRPTQPLPTTPQATSVPVTPPPGSTLAPPPATNAHQPPAPTTTRPSPPPTSPPTTVPPTTSPPTTSPPTTSPPTTVPRSTTTQATLPGH